MIQIIVEIKGMSSAELSIVKLVTFEVLVDFMTYDGQIETVKIKLIITSLKVDAYIYVVGTSA